MNNPDYGKRLLWIKNKLDLTYQDIEERTGVQYRTFKYWEKGTRTNRWEDLRAVSNLFASEWQGRWSHSSMPAWDNKKVPEINLNFVMFGHED